MHKGEWRVRTRIEKSKPQKSLSVDSHARHLMMAHSVIGSTPSSEMDAQTDQSVPVISGRASRFAAMQMDLGNMISMLLPPLPLLWFGGSMLVYALHRHHPNPTWTRRKRCRPS